MKRPDTKTTSRTRRIKRIVGEAIVSASVAGSTLLLEDLLNSLFAFFSKICELGLCFLAFLRDEGFELLLFVSWSILAQVLVRLQFSLK